VRRTSATGDEVEGTTNVIARLVAFKFSFDDGYGMRFHPIAHVMFFFFALLVGPPLRRFHMQ
jgi:hypothetical protein